MAKNKAGKIQFSTEKRKISDLIDYEYNPRTLTKKQFDDLTYSFNKFGYVEICAINLDNTILAGHQRIHVMKDLGWNDQEIEVRVPNCQLSEDEFKEYLLISNKSGGDFCYDMLGNNFDIDLLVQAGFTLEELHMDSWESDLDDSVKDQSDDSLTACIKIECLEQDKEAIKLELETCLAGYDNIKFK